MDAEACVVALAQIGAGIRHGPLPQVNAPADWSRIIELAIAHCVDSLVWKALVSAGTQAAPADVMQVLDDCMRFNRGARMMCEHALGSFLALARSEGIDVIVFKGASLAHTLYAEPDLRPYHDLDILCRPADQPRLYRAMEANGYTTETPPEVLPIVGRSAPVCTFVDPSRALEIEVHSDIFQLGLAERHQADLWRDARTITCGDLEVHTLSPVHQFLHLAVHAHRHCYNRLIWLIDLDLLLRRQRGALDWEQVVAVARNEGFGTIVRHVLASTHALLDSPLPDLPRPTLEERVLEVCYRRLWSDDSLRRLDPKMHFRALKFSPETGDFREVVYGMVLLGRRWEKWQILVRHWWSTANLALRGAA